MKLIIAILLTILTACGQTTKSTTNKTKIDFDAVDHVEIKQRLHDQTTVRLTDQQTEDFVANWNNSKSEGLCKYMPTLWLTLTVKDGVTRTFRANGESIKENNDWCFSIGDNDFFDHLWTENQKE
ncbi:MAG: hypothetical protein AAF740_07545 [Bacteroidota bacterium]